MFEIYFESSSSCHLNLIQRRGFNTEGLTVNTTWMSLGAMATLAPAVYRRLQLSRAKHRSLAGHSLMAKRLARLLPGYHFDEQAFFKCDNAPVEIENLRKQAFYRIAATLKERHPLSLEASAAARE